MVIVSSAKALPKSKKKSLAAPVVTTGNGKKSGGVGKNNATTASNAKFSRPAPRPLAVAAATLVGGGRGKVKTTRNNTLPLPSPKSGLLTNGPRIHAQRKFAQGACTTFGSSGLSSVHAGYSPAVTPTKDGTKFRKRVLTPISPPLKRPKTEDFLTFLCFRGTPALPPELDYFNYSQPLQVEDIHIHSKKPKESSVVSVSTGVGSTNTDTSHSVVSISSSVATAVANGGPLRTTTNSSGSGVARMPTPPTVTGNRNGKQSLKSLANCKRNSLSVSAVPKKQLVGSTASEKEKKSEQVSTTSAKKDGVGTVQKKVITGTGKSTATKKAAATAAATIPQISPSTSRINEQDAKFAMTALKLKYQEKRLASVRPAKSLITMLTKKVKERSMVLTRSRAKTAVGPLKTSPLQRKRNQQTIVRPPSKPIPSRNAPSPDIILGVAHSPVKPVESRRSSSSGSDSSSQSSSSSESEDEPEPTTTRSLRNGKEVVTKTKPKSDHHHQTTSLSSSSKKKKSSSPTRRMGTRSSHRHTKSPLRELPMWNVNVKKKKILAKYKKNNAKAKATLNKNAGANKNSLQSKSGTSHVTRSSLRKSSGFNKGRPSRKTKETAAIYLGLLNKGFSSDDDESNAESDDEDRESSVGDTSSSETKFLEKHYNASLKRTSTTNPKKKEGKPSSSSSTSVSRLRSHQQQQQQSQKSCSKMDSNNKSSKSSSRSSEREKSPLHQKKKKEKEKPMRRVLRSQSSGSVDSNSRTDSTLAAERRRILMMTCSKNTAGAARKSAKVVSRGRRSRNFSSSDDDDDEPSEKSHSSSDGDDDERDEDVNEVESDSQTEEEEREEKPLAKRESTASPMSIPSSRGSRAKVKRVAELINEFKGTKSPSSSRRSLSSSPVEPRSRSESEDGKSITSEIEKGTEQIDEIESQEDEDEEMEVDGEEEVEEEEEDDEDEQVDDDDDEEEDEEKAESAVEDGENEIEKLGVKDVEDEDEEKEEIDDDDDEEDEEELEDDDVVPSPVTSVQESMKEDDEPEVMENVNPSPVISSPSHSSSTSPTASSDSEIESDDEEDEDAPEPVPKVSIAIQVDMDLEEEEEQQEKLRQEEEQEKLRQEEEKRKQEEAKRREEEERKRQEEEQRLQEEKRKRRAEEEEKKRQEEQKRRHDEDKRRHDEDKKRQDEDKRRQEEVKRQKEEKRNKEKKMKAEALAKETAARTKGIELPLSEQQRAELREAQEEDDEIQEIGQVINNPAALHSNINHHHHHHHHHSRRASPSPPIIPEPQHIHHHPHPQQPEHVPLSIPLPLPPLTTSRTSSLTYTSHHINLGGSSVPFVPYSSRPPTSDFFPPPPIHFGHTHLVNSVHLVGSSTTGHAGVDFTSELTSPLSTLSIPVSVPTLPSFPNSLLPPAPPICLGPGGATMTATSLQTHIRTVATNLDIPLVRPVVGSADSSFTGSFSHFGMGPHSQLGSVPLLGAPPTASLLSRPPGVGAWAQHTPTSVAAAAAAAAAAAEVRNHYSAFRLPTLHPPSSSASAMGVKDIMRSQANSLPVSIVHPRTMPQQQLQHSRSSHHHHHQQHGVGTACSSVPVSQQSMRDNNNMHHLHQQHSSSSAYMQSYNPESIIRNLPNVSIVPKFDRSSVKTQLPSQKPNACSSSNNNNSSSSSASSSNKKQSSTKPEEPKKPGKKKSKPSTLPTPSSPLTVRKDSNPATYIGVSSKLKKKSDANEDREKEKTASSTGPSQKNRESANTNEFDKSSPKETNEFDKLLNVKLERPDTFEETSPVNTPSSLSSTPPSKDNKGKNSPCVPLIRLDQIKQEVGVSCPSSSSKKSSSPSVGHRKTPDRPSSTSSANANNEKSQEEGGKKSASSSSSSSSNKANSSAKKLAEAPTYHPTEQEFEDPLKYFDKIQPEAEKYGMARIVPPRSFRPECNVNDDMRFTAYNHYIHKMFKRWGPTVQETEAIKEHLKHSDVDVSTVPVIGGLEIDFSTLYQIVQSFGGLKEVIEKEKWNDVADRMHIPKGTHDRATKLDSVYVKYILPFDLLSEEERSNLKGQVKEKWVRRQQKLQERTDESSEDETSDDEDSMDELDDCVIKGKGTPLSSYYRTARNTVGMIFPNGKEPSIQELEEEYWKIVREGKKHLCVYSGSIDCAGVGWGFPVPKASAKHPWNLKVLANNAGSVLRSMGPVMGATVPTLHVSMLFTSYCWYRDPHGLPWVEYLHSGASKIWYSVAAAHEQILRKALMKLMPLQCKNKKLWLPSDSAMVPPELLLENNVPLVRAVQNPGEFLVVFPKSYTSAICAGYLVSESVCFAPPPWLKSCMELFKDIRDSKEPPVFPVEKLLLSIVRDNRVTSSVIKMAAPLAEKVIMEELALRKKLTSMGVSQGGCKPNKNGSAKGVSKKKKLSTEEEVEQCYFCNYILHMSLVRNERTDFVTCLPHAIQHLSRHKAQIKKCSLLCEETQEGLESLLQTAKRRANSM